MSRAPYQLLSLLLQYPGEEILAARPELETAIREVSRARERRELEVFWAWFGAAPGTELQQAYVETFDLQKRSSLYLTFFSEGDTRKRGQALLRLKRLYAAAGLELDPKELPDYLPVMLEFADFAPEGVGRRLLTEHRHALELLRLHLTEVKSPYRHLLEVVCAGLPRLRPADLESIERRLTEGPPLELVGLRP
jgi:nitrate reductase delta subunit